MSRYLFMQLFDQDLFDPMGEDRTMAETTYRAVKLLKESKGIEAVHELITKSLVLPYRGFLAAFEQHEKGLYEKFLEQESTDDR